MSSKEVCKFSVLINKQFLFYGTNCTWTENLILSDSTVESAATNVGFFESNEMNMPKNRSRKLKFSRYLFQSSKSFLLFFWIFARDLICFLLFDFDAPVAFATKKCFLYFEPTKSYIKFSIFCQNS